MPITATQTYLLSDRWVASDFSESLPLADHTKASPRKKYTITLYCVMMHFHV